MYQLKEARVKTKAAIEELIVRLERSNQSISRLKGRLGSYLYEPKDYECFKELNALRRDFTELDKKQTLLFDRIQHASITTDEARRFVEESIQYSKLLERRVSEYLIRVQD